MGANTRDLGWMYLLAGAGAVGALMYARSTSAAAPLGAIAPLASKKPVRHIDLRGDELAVAIAPPLARLLATRGVSMEDRWSRAGWSTNDASWWKPADATVLAVGPASHIPLSGVDVAGLDQRSTRTASKARTLVRWATSVSDRSPTLVLVHPRAPIGKEILRVRDEEARLGRPVPPVLLLRDLPLDPDGVTPTLATAAVWATDLVHALPT